MFYSFLTRDNKHLIHFDLQSGENGSNYIEFKIKDYEFLYCDDFSNIIECSMHESVRYQRISVDFRKTTAECKISHDKVGATFQFILSRNNKNLLYASMRNIGKTPNVNGLETTLIHYLALIYQEKFDTRLNYLFPLKYLRT